MSTILECKNLSKKYGRKQALDNITLSLESGKIIGLLGPNGSGKTTLIKLINGLLAPTGGKLFINGNTPGVESKKIVSYLPERTYLDETQKVSEAITLFEDFYKDFDRSRAISMLEKLNIDSNARIKTLSKGTKEKVKLLFDIGFPGDFDRINHAINVKFVEFDGESKIEGKDFVAYSKYVKHGNFEPAYGYIITLNNKKIGFSGDSKFCNAIENIVEETDISILDMSHAQNVSPAHMGIEDIKYLCNKYKNKTIISTHMHEYTKGQALRLNIKNFIVGKDNLKISI